MTSTYIYPDSPSYKTDTLSYNINFLMKNISHTKKKRLTKKTIDTFKYCS